MLPLEGTGSTRGGHVRGRKRVGVCVYTALVCSRYSYWCSHHDRFLCTSPFVVSYGYRRSEAPMLIATRAGNPWR